MNIKILMENTCLSDDFAHEHGLCVYVETDRHKLLVDSGQTGKAWDNAAKLGVDLAEVDALILSHGHYDHSGGILSFRDHNQTAPVYMQRTAARSYYHDERYIGIDPDILKMEGLYLLDGDYKPDDQIHIFSGITGRRFWPQSNKVLTVEMDGKRLQDTFDHEQCVVIRAEKNVLISGCAHNGILNIMDRYKEIYGEEPDVVITGFHMMKKTDYTEEEIAVVKATARELSRNRTIFYSGHCTGGKAMRLMKPILGDQLVEMHSGMEIEL